MIPKIKLCGLTRKEDIDEANRLMPEYIGFVFYEKSPRFLTPAQAEMLKARLSPEIKAVGVFVDAPVSEIAELAGKKIIDLAQLHGKEDPAYLKELKAAAKIPLIKAFQIRKAEDLDGIDACAADHILLDSGTGSGKPLDWDLLRSVKRPFFLAGGLDPENVETALAKLSPYAVDVSSGIETDRRKDPEKMRDFIKIVRKGTKDD